MTDPGFWLMVATFVYAVSTAALAWVTHIGSKRAVTGAREAARVQALTSAISTNRQMWINQLRDEVTGFVTDNNLHRRVARIRDGEKQLDEQYRILAAKRRHLSKVRLLLNPNEGVCNELIDMLSAGEVKALDAEAENQIIAHTQGILKVEWNRVKAGE